MSKSAVLLYPNQLFHVDYLPRDVDEVILVEEPLMFGTDSQHRMYVHKQKLVFLRATMRRYTEQTLWPAGYKVDYIEHTHLTETEDIVEKLKDYDHISLFEIDDDIISRRLFSAIEAHPERPEITVVNNPNFYVSSADCRKFFEDKQHTRFADFYQWQRERFNIMIDQKTYKPLEGSWVLDTKKPKKLPASSKPPSFQIFGANNYVAEAIDYVNTQFPENPGSVTDFPWPTSHGEAEAWFLEFLQHRLEKYAMYEHAIDGDMPWMYHSAISPMLNCGLLQPQTVVDTAVNYAESKSIAPEVLEPFIRNIVGWREYVRAVYKKRHVTLRTANKYNHTRRMTHDWYSGTTGIQPVDDIIRKVHTRAYTHQAERIMVLGNIMFLCEFHPDEIYRWFMEMFIDSYDWTVVPNVYGLSQNAAGMDTSQPGISSSNYILSLSHYERGEWSDIWDGLYWRCVEKNKELFAKNPGMSRSVKQLERMNKNRKRIIGYRADDFLNAMTVTDTSAGQ